MWFVLAVQVLLDGLDMQQVMFGLSCFSVILSMLVGTKVSKVASDIARKSYRLYDRDGDGRISAEELEAMQSEVGSTDRSQLNVVNSGMGDQNFWCGSSPPRVRKPILNSFHTHGSVSPPVPWMAAHDARAANSNSVRATLWLAGVASRSF